MKPSVKILAIFIIMSFISCNENLINQPEVSANIYAAKTDFNVNDITFISPVIRGEIKLYCNVFDPVAGESQINGNVTYAHHILQRSGNISRIKVNLELNAELCSKLMAPVKHSIYGTTFDTVSVEAGGKVLIDKYYGVLYRPDLTVYVQYLITPVGIGIMQVNLSQKIEHDI